MSEINKKTFLDTTGLALYDELIKSYIKDSQAETVSNANEQFRDVISRLDEIDNTEGSGKLPTLENTIKILNGDENQEGSIAKQIKNATSSLIDGAPEALDTLKEVADWISSDESGTTALVNRVTINETNIAQNKTDIAANATAIKDLKAYVDAQLKAYYDSIYSVQDGKIKALFAEAVAVEEGQTVQDAINNLESDQKLVISAPVTENLEIPENAIIDGNGYEFSGNIVIHEGAIIIDSVFTGIVTVQ